MKHQALRPVALMLCVLLATSAPAHAGTVHFADVMRAAAEGRRLPSPDLRLRAMQQQGGKAPATGVQGAPGGGSGTATVNDTTKLPDTAGGAPVSVISPEPAAAQQGGNVETVDLGDVTGTVCDCGMIPEEIIPKGGFPLWPLLGLAGVPLFFIDRNDRPTPPTTPTPPDTPVPEPATLLLFGSSLLALGSRARRRRGERHLAVAARDAEVA